MQTVILSGGLATRLRPLTETLPKAMIPVAGRPFIDHQLQLLNRNGIKDVVLCLGYLGEQIEAFVGDGSAWKVRVRYTWEKEQLLGTGGALKLAEPLLDEEFFLTYGDSYLPIDYVEVAEAFSRVSNLGMMVVYKNEDRFERSNVVLDGDLVCNYDKQERTPDMVYIDYGLTALKKEAVKLIPSGTVSALDSLIRSLVEAKQLAAYITTTRFFEIGSWQGIRDLEKFLTTKTRVL
ncbi:MAG: nucleotidyltransferase family protein [Deltaproteobacteria bacterium]